MIDKQSQTKAEFDGSSEACQYDVSPSESISVTIVEAVADVKGVEPLELESLYEAIDPDVLEIILTSPAGETAETDRKATFLFDGTEVTVRGAGEVTVRPTEQADS